MHRILLSLDTFTMLLSLLGVVLPVQTPLRFLFPHLEVSLAGLLLTSGAVYAQLRHDALKPLTVKCLVVTGLVLLLVTVERLVVSNNSGFLNSRISHADLFIVASLGVAYVLTALDRSAAVTVRATLDTLPRRQSRPVDQPSQPRHPRMSHWPPAMHR